MFGSKDLVGFTLIKLSALVLNKGSEVWYQLALDNEKTGELKIRT